jgi:hypothetical protein
MKINQSLTLRQKRLLKSKEPKDFFTLFNEIHNAEFLNTSVGNVEIKIDEKKKNNNKQKSKKRN